VGALDPEPIEDRKRIGDPQRHRVGRGVVGLVATTVATVIGEDHAEALSGEGIGHRPLAQVPDGVGETVV
jgi:hypothetical protein